MKRNFQVRVRNESCLTECRRNINMENYLASRHPSVATHISITGNGFVESCDYNVLIRITANPTQASQRYLWETNSELLINLVRKQWRKVVVTPWSKRHVVSKWCSVLTILMFNVRPGKMESLKISFMSVKRNVVNPANPIKYRKGRAEDSRKSECHFVMKWIRSSETNQIRYPAGNSAHFCLVLLKNLSENNFNQERR